MTPTRHFLFLCCIILLLTSCASFTTPEPDPLALSPETPVRPSPTPAPPGTEENPLVLSLPPAQSASKEQIQAANELSAQLTELTGYTIVVVLPESETRLVGAIEAGNVQAAILSPYAYVHTYQEGLVNASFARLKDGEMSYGAQYIARADGGFRSYFNERNEENTADAAKALSQFRDKKPCWTDNKSPSGFVVPAGILAYNGISTRPPAILEGHAPVAQAVYTGGICDFGATYIDARTFPLVKDRNPDILDEVLVIWRVPPVIPYDVFVLARSMPPEMLTSLDDALFRILGMESGKKLFRDAFGTDEWERITDTFYEQFRAYVIASGVDLLEIID